MTSLHVIYGLALPPIENSGGFRLLHLSIVDAPCRVVAYNIAKLQTSKIYVALLPV